MYYNSKSRSMEQFNNELQYYHTDEPNRTSNPHNMMSMRGSTFASTTNEDLPIKLEKGDLHSPSVSPLPFYDDLMGNQFSLPHLSSQSYYSANTVDSLYNGGGDQHGHMGHMASNSTFQWQPHMVHNMGNNFVPNSESLYSRNTSMKDRPLQSYAPSSGFSLHHAMKFSIHRCGDAKHLSESTHTSGGTSSITEKPVKTLSAYNFFFRHQRERIVAGLEDAGDDYSEARKESLLFEHWHKDRTIKRRHRKSHGKVSFAVLSRIVAQRWKELPEHRKDFYKDLAAEDLKRYRYETLQHEMGHCTPYTASKYSMKARPIAQLHDINFQASNFFDFVPIPTISENVYTGNHHHFVPSTER